MSNKRTRDKKVVLGSGRIGTCDDVELWNAKRWCRID